MKIYIAKLELDRIGGGWTFQNNLYAGLKDYATEDYNEADVYLIAGSTMVQREDVEKAKADGKKIILRIDNAVRNSRNRNTGMSRMKDFAEKADLVIYQSNWAKNYLQPFTQAKNYSVILNGTDTDIYNSNGKGDGDFILYSRFNRDETKNWEVARYWYSQYFLDHFDSQLLITGQFSEELIQYNFDFYNNEKYDYCGILDTRSMAKIYAVAHKFLYTYYNDACSNSLIEALCAGCEIVGDEFFRQTGGAPEVIHNFKIGGRDYFSLKRMAKDYLEEIKKL